MSAVAAAAIAVEAEWPDTWRVSCYVDETRAVEPLERTAKWEAAQLPGMFRVAV